MDLSPIGRAAIEAREGNRLTAYRDSVGVWTIGVGLTTASGLITVTPGLTITAAKSDALFAAASAKYAAPVRAALVKPVPQPFFDACVSLAYNIGTVGFAHSSVCRLANAGNLPAAVEAFLMWNKPAAIISRRQGEHDQAALATYDGAKVYARRGDRVPVIAVASSVAPAIACDPMVALTKPAPAAAPARSPPKLLTQPAVATAKAASPAPATPASTPVASGLFGSILGRLRAAYPVTPKKV